MIAEHGGGPIKRPKLEAADPDASPSEVDGGHDTGDGFPRVSAVTSMGPHSDRSRSVAAGGGSESEPEYAAAEYGYGGGAAAAAAAAVANAVGGGSGDDGPPGTFGTPDAGAMAGALMGELNTVYPASPDCKSLQMLI